MELTKSLGINIVDIIIYCSIFFIIFILVKKFLVTPIEKILDERAKAIHEINQNAKRADDKLLSSSDSAKKTISNAKEEANNILSQAKEEAQKEAEIIITEARNKAKQIIEQANEKQKADAETLENKINIESSLKAKSILEKLLKGKNTISINDIDSIKND